MVPNFIVTTIAFVLGIFITAPLAKSLDDKYKFTQGRNKKGQIISDNKAILFYSSFLLGTGLLGAFIQEILNRYLFSNTRHLATISFIFFGIIYNNIKILFRKKIKFIDGLIFLWCFDLALVGYFWGNEFAFGLATFVLIFFIVEKYGWKT